VSGRRKGPWISAPCERDSRKAGAQFQSQVVECAAHVEGIAANMKRPDNAGVGPRIPRKQRSGLRVDRSQTIPSLTANLREPPSCVEHVVCDRKASHLRICIGHPVADCSGGAIDGGQDPSRLPGNIRRIPR
jgi:hypothetical protein